MVMAPREHIQEQHEAMPNVSMREYLSHFGKPNRRVPPPTDRNEGTTYAYLNHGLWMAPCIAGEGCYGLVFVTSRFPYMWCVDCGAGWFDVEFPKNKEAIVRELEKRPIPRLGMLHANWVPGETLAKLRRETKAGRNVD